MNMMSTLFFTMDSTANAVTCILEKKHIVHIKKANAAHRNPLPLEVITKPLLSLHF